MPIILMVGDIAAGGKRERESRTKRCLARELARLCHAHRAWISPFCRIASSRFCLLLLKHLLLWEFPKKHTTYSCEPTFLSEHTFSLEKGFSLLDTSHFPYALSVLLSPLSTSRFLLCPSPVPIPPPLALHMTPLHSLPSVRFLKGHFFLKFFWSGQIKYRLGY